MTTAVDYWLTLALIESCGIVLCSEQYTTLHARLTAELTRENYRIWRVNPKWREAFYSAHNDANFNWRIATPLQTIGGNYA